MLSSGSGSWRSHLTCAASETLFRRKFDMRTGRNRTRCTVAEVTVFFCPILNSKFESIDSFPSLPNSILNDTLKKTCNLLHFINLIYLKYDKIKIIYLK